MPRDEGPLGPAVEAAPPYTQIGTTTFAGMNDIKRGDLEALELIQDTLVQHSYFANLYLLSGLVQRSFRITLLVPISNLISLPCILRNQENDAFQRQ